MIPLTLYEEPYRDKLGGLSGSCDATHTDGASAAARRQHNLDLALKLAQVFAIHPCRGKNPIAKRHTKIDTEIDRAAAIKGLKAKHEKTQAKLPEPEREEFRIPMQIGSSKNPESIQRWSEEIPDFVPAISGGAGNGLYIVDCDKAKKGGDVDGVDYFRELADANGFELSTVPGTRTQSGGLHLYFRNSHRLGCSAKGFFGKNIQIRAEGGYVIAPGAIREDGRTYTPLEGHPDLLEAVAFEELIDAPQWLIDAAGSNPILDNEFKDAPAGFNPEDPTIVDHFLFELDRRHPNVLATGDRHQTLMDAAHLAFDCGLYEDQAIEIIAPWFEAHCAEPLPEGEIEETILRMCNCRQDAIGRDYVANWTPAGNFGAVEDPDEAPAPTLKPKAQKEVSFQLVSFAEAARRALTANTKPLIKGVLDQSAFSVMYGPSNVGKSFFALDMAFHIATGRPWRGHKTTQMPVLYLAAEGSRNFLKRIAALKLKHAIDNVPLDLLPEQVGLRDSIPNRDALVKAISSQEDTWGAPCGLIVIDTLSQALAGGDENSSVDMGLFIAVIAHIRKATGAHTMLIHHSGKDIAKGGRGWSGVRGAIDTEIELDKDKKGEGAVATIKKQRDMEGVDRTYHYALESVVLGKDEDGDDVTSAVIVPEKMALYEVVREKLSGRV
jgi:hypothetical protein